MRSRQMDKQTTKCDQSIIGLKILRLSNIDHVRTFATLASKTTTKKKWKTIMPNESPSSSYTLHWTSSLVVDPKMKDGSLKRSQSSNKSHFRWDNRDDKLLRLFSPIVFANGSCKRTIFMFISVNLVHIRFSRSQKRHNNNNKHFRWPVQGKRNQTYDWSIERLIYFKLFYCTAVWPLIESEFNFTTDTIDWFYRLLAKGSLLLKSFVADA